MVMVPTQLDMDAAAAAAALVHMELLMLAVLVPQVWQFLRLTLVKLEVGLVLT
jgi:hypothetical protein